MQLKEFPSVPVLGGERVTSLTRQLKDRETFNIGADIKVTALHTPCHTQDSICYFVEDSKSGEKAVFTGDTLFIGGKSIHQSPSTSALAYMVSACS